MNSNLRSMIEDALDGELQDETFSYDSYEDVPSAYGGDEITKLASALNFVATNLDDLGTTDEKLAELELLQEKIATAETAAAGEAAEDTLGAFYKNLKGGSKMSLSDAFGKLSTGRKFAVGGGAGLIGLGALYGGAKMLGGGGGEQTNVVKVSSLQDAKQRALVKMAEHYNIPVWELEKLALSPLQDRILSGLSSAKEITEVAKPGEGATKQQLSAYKQYERQMAARQRAVASIIGDGKGITDAQRKALDVYAKGGKIESSTVTGLRDTLAASPTSASAIQSGDRVLGARVSPDPKGAGMTRNRQGSVVSGNRVQVTKGDGTKIMVDAKYRGLTPAQVDAKIKDGKISPKGFEAATGDALATERKAVADQSRAELQQKQKAIADQRAARQGSSNAPRDSKGFLTTAGEKQYSNEQRAGRGTAKAQRGAKMERAAVRNQLLGPQSRTESKELRSTLKSGVDKILEASANKSNALLTGREVSALKSRFGDNYATVITNAGNLRTDQAAESAQKTRRRSGVKGGRQANQASATTQGRRTGGLGSKAGQAATEAGEKELGFFAKNRRALLGAGALGAAGLAGYGAYRAFGGGGQSKAASYRGMRKLAEDRISPARIRAGKADPFSGMDIHRPGMSRSASPYEPIGIKAQRIRDQINSDMRGYVSHVGGGYNLDNYLNKFNK